MTRETSAVVPAGMPPVLSTGLGRLARADGDRGAQARAASVGEGVHAQAEEAR